MAYRFWIRPPLLLLVLMMSIGVAESVVDHVMQQQQQQQKEVNLEPADAGGYRKYVVLLGRPSADEVIIKEGDGEEDIAAAHRAWHQSYLPSILTSLGEPRLMRSYDYTVVNGFYARLTPEELKVVSGKRGFLNAIPNYFEYLDDLDPVEF